MPACVCGNISSPGAVLISMKIYHDDHALDIIDKVNKLLKKHGLWFDDSPTEDGKDFLAFKLVEKKFDTSDE